VRSRPALSPRAPDALRLTLLDETNRPLLAPDVIETRPGSPVSVRLAVRALDATGAEVSARGDVLITIAGEPRSVIAGRSTLAAAEVPATISGLAFAGAGRSRLRASARLEDGRTIRGSIAANVLPRGIAPGPPERLALEIEDLLRLEEGTAFDVDVLDGRGFFASDASGVLDLSRSDPWVFFPDGPGREITRLDRGHIRHGLARPSGPRGLPVVLRATLTSTAVPAIAGVLTSSIVLPLLETPR
jgi:hypothetical protein